MAKWSAFPYTATCPVKSCSTERWTLLPQQDLGESLSFSIQQSVSNRTQQSEADGLTQWNAANVYFSVKIAIAINKQACLVNMGAASEVLNVIMTNLQRKWLACFQITTGCCDEKCGFLGKHYF